jgi:hypothetical protein
MQIWFMENQVCQNAGINSGEERELTHVLISLISCREHNLVRHIQVCKSLWYTVL